MFGSAPRLDGFVAAQFGKLLTKRRLADADGPRPPLFLAIAVDDPLFKQGGLNLIDKWLKESSRTELHLYSGGNHGFGMRPQGTTSDNWMDHYLSWLA